MKLREDIPQPELMDSPVPAKDFSSRKLAFGTIAYGVLLVLFWFIARLSLLRQLREHPISTFVSFAILFAPYWLFGFGAADWIRHVLRRPVTRVAAAGLLAIPYFVLSIPRGDFRWTVALVLIGIAVLSAAVLQRWQKAGTWADLAVLATVGLVIDLGLLNTAGPLAAKRMIWPSGLGGFPKMMMADVALYCYLVVKPIEGIGYDLVPRLSDFKTGLREFLFYAPIVIPLGFLLGFLHFHRSWPEAWMPPAAWTFTFIFVALPEELFFRGLAQNMLQRHLGRNGALLLASILFGLSHFNKTSGGRFLLYFGSHAILFNWRYVLLATVAGLFYGRAWRENRRLFASSITHASVDTVWSLWFR